VSVWRHLSAGGLSKPRARLGDGVRILSEHRDGKGGWRRFPFHYTLLGLCELTGKVVAEELQYAAPRLERMLRRRGRGDLSDIRRRAVAERVLSGL